MSTDYGTQRLDERCRISLSKVFRDRGLWDSARHNKIDVTVTVDDSTGIITLVPVEYVSLAEYLSWQDPKEQP